MVGCRRDVRRVGALVRGPEVLLAYRNSDKRAYPAVWELPCGVAEAGESELETLARELREELGVRIAPDSATHLCRVPVEPEDGPAVISAWLVRDWQGTPTNVATEEHDDIRWFDIDDLPPPVHLPVRAALLEAMESHRLSWPISRSTRSGSRPPPDAAHTRSTRSA